MPEERQPPVKDPELNEPFFCNLTYAANQSYLINPYIQALLLQDNNSCSLRTRLELMKRYWESLDNFSQNLIKSYKGSYYRIATAASAAYLALTPEERIKKIIDRNYNALKQNKETRDEIRRNHSEINSKYILANREGNNNKQIQILVSKPDILFLLNKIVLNAPFPKEPLTLYRAMTNGNYTNIFFRMKKNEFYTTQNVLSTSTKLLDEFLIPAYAPDYYAPVALVFKLDHNYPRFDMSYIEGCIARNDELEYLLPVLLKKRANNTNEPIYTNEEYTYTNAKWKCIEKKLINNPWKVETDQRAINLIEDLTFKAEFETDKRQMLQLVFEPYTETSEPSTELKAIQKLWNSSFRAPSGKEMREQAEENSRKAMENYSARPMSQKALREQAESNSRMARYNLTQKRNGTAIRTDPFVKALGKYNIRTRKNRRN
jgi:hypothetical protein